MESFLKKVAKIYASATDVDINRVQFIFPNRRAGLFFQKEFVNIAKQEQRNSFAPQIIEIDSFVEKLSPIKKASDVELLLKLYKAYKAVCQENKYEGKNFDQFMGLGLMMLNDFNEVDKYLVDVSKLYQNLSDLKEIDAKDSLPEEIKKTINALFNTHLDSSDNDLKLNKEFITFWNLLGDIYIKFREDLIENRRGYIGLIYRYLCENQDIIESELKRYDRYVFIGLNMLTKAEEEIMKIVKRSDKRADFYFDYPEQYGKGSLFCETVGLNYESNLKNFKSLYPFEQESAVQYPEVELYGIASTTEQARVVCDIISKRIKNKKTDEEKAEEGRKIEKDTMVCLANEDLYEYFLNQKPQNISNINLSMGISLESCSISSLIFDILELHNGYSEKNGFYHTFYTAILTHPFIAEQNEALVTKIANLILVDDHNPYIKKDIRDIINSCKGCEMTNRKILEDIFTPKNNTKELIDCLLSFLKDAQKIIRAHMKEKQEKQEEQTLQQTLNIEYITQYIELLNSLNILFEKEGFKLDGAECEITKKALLSIIKRLTKVWKLQLKGEPVNGLQILGTLETRLIDYENIIITSFNDTFFPGKACTNTLIPTSFRVAYELPTYKTQEAIFQYNFYRMIYRAKKIQLIHDIRVSDDEQKIEISRIYYQLKYLLDCKIKEYQVEQSLVASHNVTINAEVTKTDDILENFERRQFSPSALKIYLNCPLAFYINYGMGIKEETEISDRPDVSLFGLLYHKCMELFYNCEDAHVQFKKKNVDEQKQYVEQIIDKAQKEIEQSAQKRQTTELAQNGYTIFFKKLLNKVVWDTINFDLVRSDFLFLESEYNTKASNIELNGVKVGGIIDRIDYLVNDKRYNIIDYKTSKHTAIDSVLLSDLFIKSQEWFQVLLYCYFLTTKPIDNTIEGVPMSRENLFPTLYKLDFAKRDKEMEVLNVSIDGYLTQYLPLDSVEKREKWAKLKFNGDIIPKSDKDGEKLTPKTSGEPIVVSKYSMIADYFEPIVDKMFEEIFDREIPFRRTERTDDKKNDNYNRSNCTYCNLYDICQTYKSKY